MHLKDKDVGREMEEVGQAEPEENLAEVVQMPLQQKASNLTVSESFEVI
jgi:hypothetical protein